MKRKGRQRQTCQFWYPLANANRAAQCWAMSTGLIRGNRDLMPPSCSELLTETCTPVACQRSFLGLWQCSSSASSHKIANGPASGLMPFYCPFQLSLYWPSTGISSMFLRLCWETQQTLLRPHVRMCHPGGAGLPVQPDWAAGTSSCYQ